MTTPAGDDGAGDAHDAWLKQALRHAPDADTRPPAELSEAILREAAVKARRPAASAARGHGQPARLWAWLGRPGAAAGMAGVMVAVLVGVMWWQEPLPDSAELPAALPAPAAQPPQAAEALPEPRPAAPVRSLQERPVSTRGAPTAAREAAKAKSGTETRGPDAPVRTASPGARIEPLEPPPPPSAAVLAERAGALAGAQRRMAAPESSRAEAAAVADAVSGLRLAALRARIAAEAPRWSARRDGGELHAMDAALQAWLARLDTLAGNAWTATPPADLAAQADAMHVELLREGQPVARLALDGAIVRWHTPQGGTAWRLMLPAGQAHVLRESLAAALPR